MTETDKLNKDLEIYGIAYEYRDEGVRKRLDPVMVTIRNKIVNKKTIVCPGCDGSNFMSRCAGCYGKGVIEQAIPSSMQCDESWLDCPFCGSRPEHVNLTGQMPGRHPGVRCPHCLFTIEEDRPDKTKGMWNRRVIYQGKMETPDSWGRELEMKIIHQELKFPE